MSMHRAHQGQGSIVRHHPLMAALIGVSLGAGFLVAGASSAAGAEAQPFCSEYDEPKPVAPVEVSPNEVTPPPPTTPIAVVPVVAEPAPTAVAPPPVPEVVAPAEVTPPPPTVAAEVPVTTEAPKTTVLGEVVVNDQSTAPTLPVTGLPTGELLAAAVLLLMAGEAMRRTAARRVEAAIAGEAAAQSAELAGGLTR